MTHLAFLVVRSLTSVVPQAPVVAVAHAATDPWRHLTGLETWWHLFGPSPLRGGLAARVELVWPDGRVVELRSPSEPRDHGWMAYPPTTDRLQSAQMQTLQAAVAWDRAAVAADPDGWDAFVASWVGGRAALMRAHVAARAASWTRDHDGPAPEYAVFVAVRSPGWGEGPEVAARVPLARLRLADGALETPSRSGWRAVP